MPPPRKPRPKHRPGQSRASRRRAHQNRQILAKIIERFMALQKQIQDRRQWTYRGAYGAISYFQPGVPIPPGYEKVEFDENGDEIAPSPKEKAPDLSTEGFSSFFREREAPSG